MSITKLLILAALIYVAIRVYHLLRAQTSQEGRSRPSPPRQAMDRSAHEVLGVAPGSSQTEIKAAYQRLVQQYHPDRVADMGPELREVAEERTKEINAAYSALKRG